MKKIVYFISINLVLLACSKEKLPPTPAIDYSKYKLKETFHCKRNFSGNSSTFSADTTIYTYNGSTIQYTNLAQPYKYYYTITLEGNLYTQVLTTNNAASPYKTYYRLNAAGYIDSNWIATTSGTTQRSWTVYNANGTKDMETADFISYKNIKKYHYQNGIANYSYNERLSYSPSIAPAKDSVVYEYTSLPFRADYFNTGMSVSLFGKPDKQLLKKATYFDQLDNNVIRQTMEYSYQTNSIGLITQKILNLYAQPGKTLMLADTTTYNYYNL
ncbi:MAG TPA: hypothetical protein PKA77_00370 [Chitinophagaceae bacterium]|jgi:hypothetical protein|nr:hypothetical protein [Chitinophagaceae bacterium]HMU59117.1 hypothetical protein [Chitinophagaceae bacterium]